MDSETKNWAMFVHLSLLAGYVLPLAGYVAPIIIWQIKKDEMPEIDAHGKMAVNFIISMFLYSIISGIAILAVVGIFMLMALGVIGVVYPVIGGIKANNGELWNYPGIIKFVT